MLLQVGDVAPDFELPASGNRTVRLSGFRGKKNVLLAFYPFAFSPVCSLQLPGLQQNLREFQDLNTEVLGISVDSKHSSAAFAEHLHLDFPLLSDFNKDVTSSYGVLREGGFAERALFVIDKDGIVRHKHIGPVTEKSVSETILPLVRQLKGTS